MKRAGLGLLFVLGAILGIAIGIVAFVVSLVRGKRAVHGEGWVCTGELTGRFAGPVRVRLSGAFEGDASTSDVLGMTLRIDGTQDLLLGTFESFATARHDRAATVANDFLANGYASVTPWWVPGFGVAHLRMVPVGTRPPERGATRLARLDADLAADAARMTLFVEVAGRRTAIGDLGLLARLPADEPGLRASMFHTGRGIWPLGLRNGIRATTYPLSRAGRTLRGG